MVISLHMIVKNEQEHLPTVLKSIRDWVEEIIIVDTGSSDDTVGVAESFGARVAYFDWCDDFSAARNRALDLVKTPWTIWLDADDLCLNPQLIPHLLEYARKRRITSLWSVYKQDETCHQRRLQIFKPRDYRWKGVVHENPVPKRPTLAYGDLTDLIVIHRKPQARRPEAARRYLEILLKKDPDNWLGLAESHRYLAICTTDDEQLEHKAKAEEYYWQAANHPEVNDPTKYVALFQCARLNLDLAKVHQDRGGVEVAMKLVECLLGLNEDRAEGLVMAGQLAEAFGHPDDARQYYKKAMKQRVPDDIGLVFPDFYDVLPRMLLSKLEAA